MILKYTKAGLYYLDAGAETSEIIDTSHEPWRPLSKFIVTENPYNQPRTVGEVLKLKDRMEEYRLKYLQSLHPTSCCTLYLNFNCLQNGTQRRSGATTREI